MKQVILLSGLLGVALIGTYVTWFDDGETRVLEDSEVEVYDATAADLSKVVWKSEKVDVELRPAKDDKGDYVMVHVTERREKVKPPEPKPPGADDGHDHGDEHPEDEAPEEPEGDEPAEEPADEEPPEIETIVTYFKGNDAANELLENLAPLIALRSLELPADSDASAFGFDEPSATVEVHRSAGQVDLTVGGETYGSKDRYLKYEGKIFLIDDQTLRPLQYGKTRLLERNLQPLAETDITRVDVTVDGKTASFEQQDRDDRAKAFWAAAETPETEHEVAGTWLGKAFKMRVRSYVEPTEVPELQPVFTVVMHGEEDTWTIDVSRSADDDKKYYATSDFLRSTVELTASLAESAAADVNGLFPEE